MKKDAQELFRLARTALEGAGAHPRMAEAAARHLVQAEEQGLPTHGMSRVPFYCSMLRHGRADGGAHPAIVIDLALTTVVRGKIMMAMRKGERIPEGWALDRHGKPTTDPKEAIEHGSLFPIGGAKGAMLALMFELLCASLTGAAIGPEADSFFSEEGNKPRIGQAFIAIDPAALAGMEKFSERTEAIVATMLADPEVRLPGARRFASEKISRN